ncbi:MAG: SpoIID/LytB domain-containing protein, partial [Bacteroidota bacterium]
HLFETGVTSYYQGDYQRSVEIFQEIVQSDPENDAVRLNLAQVLKEAGRYQEAIRNLTYLADKHPAESGYRMALMEAAYHGGQPELTLKLAEETELGPEALFWLGLAYMDLNQYDQAENLLQQSLNRENFNPMTYYFLGQVSLKTGRYEQAETCFKKAIAQDQNLTICFYPLVQSYLAQEKYQSAYDLLLKAEGALPWNQTVAATLKEFNTTRPEFEAKRRSAAAERRRISTPPAVGTIPPERETIPEVRIGLMEKIRQAHLKTGGEFRIAERNGTKAVTGKAKTVLLVRQSGAETEVYAEDGRPLIRSSKPLLLSYRDPEATTIIFDAQHGQGYFFAGRQDRAYRGSLELLRFEQGLTIVNRINVEEYLYAVVPSEIPSSWPKAVLEAQAVAARTYTFANLGRFDERGFDLLPTVASQVYNGVQSETKSVTDAVNSTRGLILTYQSKPIGAFYYDNCGGYTESSQSVWGFSAPYLQAVPDKLLPPRDGLMAPADLYAWLKSRPEAHSNHPKYSNRSAYRWSHWITREEIEARLKLSATVGRILSLTVVERSISGRAAKVLIKGTAGEKILKGDAIRSLGGLRSNLFVVQPKLGVDGLPESFVFTGGGWGHGVGMAQSGAAGMAAAGYGFDQILAHYYQGTELTKKY